MMQNADVSLGCQKKKRRNARDKMQRLHGKMRREEARRRKAENQVFISGSMAILLFFVESEVGILVNGCGY